MIETFGEYPPLGRIVIRDGAADKYKKVTLIAGQVKEVVKQHKNTLFSL